MNDFKRAFGILMFWASSLAALKTLAELGRKRTPTVDNTQLLASIDRRLAQMQANSRPTPSGPTGPLSGTSGILDYEDLL